jgi:hypothetical protein
VSTPIKERGQVVRFCSKHKKALIFLRGGSSGHVIEFSATFDKVGCFSAVNTFLKILLAGILVAVLLHFWPVFFALSVILGIAAALLMALGTGGISLLAGIGFAVLGVMAAIFAVGLALLSPVWLPILAVVLLIVLIRNGTRSSST